MCRCMEVPLAFVVSLTAGPAFPSGPFDGKTFRGRIAYSSHGNHNDPDDWAASPVTLAILAEAGAKNHVVHFDYNSILPQTDAEWERNQWNDGFSPKYTFTHTKRSVIPSGVRWVQIQDQNRLLSRSRYGRPAEPQEFAPYFWMRDSDDSRVRFLWERLVASTRPDPSDAGMAYFLISGDEQADPAKLERLLDKHILPAPIGERRSVRLEAENFVDLEGYEVEYRNDREASHTLNVK